MAARGCPGSNEELLAEFGQYLQEVRQLAPAVRVRVRSYAQRFLDWLGYDEEPERLGQLGPGQIEQFVLKYAEEHSLGSRRYAHYALRGLLRFCHLRGYVAADLSAAVPSVPRHRFARVPFGIDGDATAMLLASIDRSTISGQRDYAMIQLLATYGVRGVQVRELRLVDIDWRNERIRFGAVKGGREVVVPLLPEAGNALVQYLCWGRPRESTWPHVFLTLTPPFRPLADPSTLSSMVARRLRRAGVDVPTDASHGSHVFRHGLASRLLAQGAAIQMIGDLLGHRRIDTTFVYTKVDFDSLCQVPLQWPEETP